MRRRCLPLLRRPDLGLTALEILVTLAIVGLLMSITVPVLLGHTLRARAASIIGDFHLLHAATYLHYEELGTFPEDEMPGAQPEALAPYLRGRLEWDHADAGYRYDWERWIDGEGQPTHPETGILIAFSVIVDDPRLGETLRRVYEGPVVRTHPNRYAFPVVPVGAPLAADSGTSSPPAADAGDATPVDGPGSSSKGKGKAIGQSDGKGNNG